MLPLGGAVKKAWGKSDYGFPCCWGALAESYHASRSRPSRHTFHLSLAHRSPATSHCSPFAGTLSESFAKLADSIYFVSNASDAVYVNLFVSSVAELSVGGGTVKLEQRADEYLVHPTHTSTLTVHLAPPAGTLAFALKVRVPTWLEANGRISVNGEPTNARPTPGTYFTLKRAWADGDVVSLDFPPTLWTAPLNDYHAWHNATLAFMYGPLVLAGVNMTTDLFVPEGDDFRTDPSSFITRRPSSRAGALEFEARGSINESKTTIAMVPLRDVRDEQFVTYFMTAGTKPPQPAVHYCPHSVGVADGEHEEEEEEDSAGHGSAHDHDHEEEALLIQAEQPPSAPSAVEAPLRSRGVEWQVDAHSGRMWPRS